MKVLVLILVTFLNLNSCSSEKSSQEINSFVSKITVQNWVGGVKGAGGGTIVNIILSKNLPKETALSKVIFQKREGKLSKIDDLNYQVNITTFESKNDETKPMPIIQSDLKDNQVQIFFKINGKEFYTISNNVKQLPMLAYPSVKSSN